MIRLREQGFTLLEMILTLSIFGILFGMSVPVLYSFQSTNDRQLAAENMVATLRRASMYARGVNNDSQWGVRINATDFTLFKGSSYAARDTSYDETTTVPASLTLSGLSEVTFSKLNGTPNATGTVTLTSPSTETSVVTLNAKGIVTY